MRRIKVICFEDPMQRMLLHNVETVIRDLKCEFTIDIIHGFHDIMEMEKAQIIVTPALIVDSHILCEGHIWNVEHIKYFSIRFVKVTQSSILHVIRRITTAVEANCV